MIRRPATASVVLVVLVSLAGCRGADEVGWSAPQQVPLPATAVPSAMAAVDAGGGVHVAWPEKRAGRWSLRAMDRTPEGAWPAPATVAAGGPFRISLVGIAANERGDVAALWGYDGGRRRVLMASVRPAGGAWERAQAVSRVSAGLTQAEIAIDGPGAVTVTGRGLAGPGLWAVRRDTDGRWAAPVRLTVEGEGVDAPELVVTPDGRAAVVALLKRPGQPRITWTAQANAAGTWAPGAVVPGSEGARLPVVAIAEDGIVAGWAEQRARDGRQRLMIARRSAAGWSRPVALDASRHDLGTLQLVPDGDGALAAWARWDAAPRQRRASIRVRRIGPRGPEAVATVAPVTFPPIGGAGVHVIYLSPPVDVRLVPGVTPTLLWSAPAGATRAAGRRLVAAQRDDGGDWRIERLGGAAGVAPLAGGEGAALWFEAPPNGAATRIQMVTAAG